MMTNALPGGSLQVIGFLLHQNQRFIDQDKVVRPGRCVINGQKGAQAWECFSSITLFFSHLQLNKAVKTRSLSSWQQFGANRRR